MNVGLVWLIVDVKMNVRRGDDDSEDERDARECVDEFYGTRGDETRLRSSLACQ